MSKLTPILKWAGGKRQLLSEIIPLVPQEFEYYYEPFVGAGAVLLDLQPQKAVVNDTNTDLINVYYIIKHQPNELIKLLKEYETSHCEEFYYKMRNIDRDIVTFSNLPIVEKAARTIYLNRTCYNGLYRVNKQGFFNTPIGRNSSIQIVSEKGILGISEYLNMAKVEILNGDYHIPLQIATKNDFVFLDPPYYPTNKDSFLRYDVSPFGIQEQLDLKEVCDQLNEKNIRFIETNSDCEEIRKLYSEYRQIEVDVRRCINAKVNGRRGKELIICNY